MSALVETIKKISKDGIWNNNVVLGQNLALCPLLAVTGTATNGLGMGLATLVVLVCSNAIVSLNRHIISAEVRIPIFVLLIATLVTLVDMSMNAWMHEMHKVLGLFIPLIVTNCAILGRAESYASRQPIHYSIWDGVMMGLGFTLVLVVLGAAREITSAGTLFANATLLLGDSFAFLELKLIPDYQGFLLMALPPGGFIMLGFIIAAKRILDRKWAIKRALLAPVV
ncbi:electron transport complex subunit E [Methylophaga sp.]|uniref:electron transport complex subunit E n=1 Tax=Methylophaga sp. TaxID=2024840 RepID=UPI002726B441|nr:electron transport complex subunit E [Methylophaga sp.]MDO8828045.1 electron transport complex subunit E [Methylophaga sp.]